MLSRCIARFAAQVLLAASLSAGAFAQAPTLPPSPTASGEIAWYSVSRAVLNPVTGAAFVYGYYVALNGVNGPMFTGAPGESTAIFTFRTSLTQLVPLPLNGDIAPIYVTPGVFNIYYNTAPKGDWSNPDTFSSGQVVATYNRNPFLLSQVGPARYEAFNASMTASNEFNYGGQKINLKNYISGVTSINVFSTTPLPGTVELPVGQALSGYALVTSLKPPANPTAAVASPKTLSVVAKEITLDGSKSTSADGKALKYQWSLAPGSPSVAIQDADTASPTVRFSNLSLRGAYSFLLTVTDSTGATATDTSTVVFQGTGN